MSKKVTQKDIEAFLNKLGFIPNENLYNCFYDALDGCSLVIKKSKKFIEINEQVEKMIDDNYKNKTYIEIFMLAKELSPNIKFHHIRDFIKHKYLTKPK